MEGRTIPHSVAIFMLLIRTLSLPFLVFPKAILPIVSKAVHLFYTIEMYPTFILMRKGEQLWRQSGELPLERLEKAVKEYELKA